MSQYQSALLAKLLVVTGFVTTVIWMYELPVSGTAKWFWTLVTSSLLAIYLWPAFRREKLPDLLLEKQGPYFENDGFCAVAEARVESGHCCIRIAFQNRFAGPVEATVVIRPVRWCIRLPPVAGIEETICCPGGGYGHIDIPCAVPREWQGKWILIELRTARRYPQGKGKLVRFRQGKGMAHITIDGFSSNRARIRLPENVSETLPDDAAPKTEILQVPGEV